MKTLLSKILSTLNFIEKWFTSCITDACGIIEKVVSCGIRVSLLIILYKIAISDFIEQILEWGK